MNTHTSIKISLISMIVRLIVERNHLDEQEAIFAFYHSRISDKLANRDVGLYRYSPYLIYELWNAEYQTGEFEQSPYYWSLL